VSFFCTNCGRDFTENRSEFFAVHLKRCESFKSKNGKVMSKYDQNTGQLNSAPSQFNAKNLIFSEDLTPVTEPGVSATPQDDGNKDISDKWCNARTITILGSKSTTPPKGIYPSNGMGGIRSTPTLKPATLKPAGLTGSWFTPPTLGTALRTQVAERPQASYKFDEDNLSAYLSRGLRKDPSEGKIDGAENVNGIRCMASKDAGHFKPDFKNTFRIVSKPERSDPVPRSISNSFAATASKGSSADDSNPFKVNWPATVTSNPSKAHQSTAGTSNPFRIERPIPAASNPFKLDLSTVTTKNPFKSNQSTAFASSNPFADSVTEENSATSPGYSSVSSSSKDANKALLSPPSYSGSPKRLFTPTITSGRCSNDLQDADQALRSQPSQALSPSRFRALFQSLDQGTAELSKLIIPALEDCEVEIEEL
jgi:hypothetical protein